MNKEKTKFYDITFSEREMEYLEYFLSESIKQCFPKIDVLNKMLDEINEKIKMNKKGISPMMSCKNGLFYAGSENEKYDVFKSLLDKISTINRTL
tara:strand:- start:160 stop:444 length:285 start_codon:yes stop_codon:yes gene_type:complete